MSSPIKAMKVYVPAKELESDYVLVIDDMMGYVKSSECPYVKEQTLYCFTEEQLSEFQSGYGARIKELEDRIEDIGYEMRERDEKSDL